MFKNYFKVTLRYFLKNKIYSSIIICGLVISLASCLLIANFLNHELSYDGFHENSKNIYRVNHLMTDQSGNITKMANTPPALIPGIREVFPEIKKATQMRYAGRTLLENGDKHFYESRGFFADSCFLEVFSFSLIQGNRLTALDQPNSILITRELATKYFGNDDPMGKYLTMNGEINLKVTGVLEAVPSNSHLQFDFLLSFSTYKVPANYLSDLTSWSWAGFLSFVLLRDGADPNIFQNKIDNIYRGKFPDDVYPNKSYVQPLENIYLGSADLVDDLASGIQLGNRFTIYSLAAVAILILLIASFNFMNLSIAVSTTRYKEMGLRKMLGAERRSLIGQLLTESVLMVVVSLFLAYDVAIVAFQYFKDALGWNFGLSSPQLFYSIPFATVIVFLVGISAGIYPAMFLSSHKSVTALKNNVKNGSGAGSTLRKFLIGFQFCISISLIAATIVITKQYQYLSNQKLGFDKENVVVVKLLRGQMDNHYDRFKENLLQDNHVMSVSQSERSMGEPWPVNMISVVGQANPESKRIVGNQVGYDYLETMGIKILEGRTFSKEYGSDATNSIIVNRKTVEYLGLSNPVGKQVDYFSINGPRKIIGIVDDFNFLSLHNEISPMCLIMPFVDLDYLYVRFTPGNLAEKITTLKNIWEKTNPGIPIEYRFMNDQLDQLYNNEQRLSSLISGFSGLAIFLACMGLFGLVTFAAEKRRKEIGIRKVLGASVSSIIKLLSADFVKIVLAANVIAWPVAYFALNKWLEDFAYRIHINWWMFAIAGVIALVIALTTVSFLAIKAATANPVEALRCE
jgi:putative ABC transport system permease protein